MVKLKAGVAFRVNLNCSGLRPGITKTSVSSTPAKCRKAIGRVALKQYEVAETISAAGMV